MNTRERYLRMLLVLLTLTSVGVAAAQDEENTPNEPAAPAELFGPTEMLRGAIDLDEAVVAFEPVSVNSASLRDAAPGTALSLNVRADLAYAATVLVAEQRAAQTHIVKGVLNGIPQSSFTFVQHRGVTVGVIRTDDPTRIYQLRYTPEGAHVLQEVDLTRYPVEACCTAHGQAFISQRPNFPDTDAAAPSVDELTGRIPSGEEVEVGGDLARGSCPDVPDVIDVLICYTTNAQAAMGGATASEAQALLAVEVSNDCYQNTGVNFRMRLVNVMPAGYTEAAGTDQEDWLDWVTNPFVAADVHAARDLYGADFISMFTGGGSGLGWCTSNANNAMSTCKWSRAVNTWTLAHEVGHNQGLAHNREDNDSCNSSSYSYGWWYVGDSGSTWGTVMAYPGTRIPYFSNPNVQFDGEPTGVPRGQTDESDNAYALNNRIVVFEGFRLTRYDVWLDFFYFNPFGNYFGSNLFPYNSLTDALDAINMGNSASETPNLWIKPGSADISIVIDEPVKIRACAGGVFIGQAP